VIVTEVSLPVALVRVLLLGAMVTDGVLTTVTVPVVEELT
jgi:hypothetical protein